MLQPSHASLLLIVAFFGFSSKISAFTITPRPAAKLSNKNSSSSALYFSIKSRRSFFQFFPAVAFTTLFSPNDEQYQACADEPNNLYYKSKADEEDPLAVFGKSLQQSIGTNSSNSPDDTNNGVQQSSKGDTTENQKDQQIMLPQGGDLGRAIMEKQQQRRIDPRTHG